MPRPPTTVRLLGGRLTGCQLLGLSELTGDRGELRLTRRANLEIRSDEEVGAHLERLDLPRPPCDVMVSPLTGTSGGRLDMAPVARELARLLRVELPPDFLVVLDDGRGDLVAQESDLLAVALDDSSVQVRVGGVWGESASLANAARLLVVLAHDPRMPAYTPDPRVPEPLGPPPYDERHVAVPDGVVSREQAAELSADEELAVTPWLGIIRLA